MRELKFRAWDGYRMRYECFPTGNNSIGYWIEKGSWETKTVDNELAYVEAGSTNYKIMQFTGLKDRNGVDIYSGDIVSLSFGIPTTVINAKVEWCENEYVGDAGVACSGWWLRGINAESAPLCTCYENDLEVIGNIHQNPELLEA